MSDYAGKQSKTAVMADAEATLGPAPGKRTRTQVEQVPEDGVNLVVQRSASRGRGPAAVGVSPALARPTTQDLFGGSVQRRAAGADPGELAPAEVQASAQRGITTPGSALPFASAIQRAFGRHDISSIQAHTGPEAAASTRAMGADAYATGDHVVLSNRTDLHTAAHEAAHVIQQRAGVHLAGGVGRDGDPYERHADAVADTVVQGRSAEGLLDQMAGGVGSPAAAGVQRRIHVDAIDGGEAFDADVDFVQSTWGFTPAEKGIYRRWLKDDQVHRYATKALLKEAIHRVAIQPFGTDIAKLYDQPAEQLEIFKQALTAGYRVFDSAATYETLDTLWAAVRELNIPRDELTIMFKIKPTDDVALEHSATALEAGPQTAVTPVEVRRTRNDKVASKLAAARDVMGTLPDVLVLHDLDAGQAAVRATLNQFAAHIRAGRARALGVSNASVPELEGLCPLATAAGAPIKYVQNRNSPYHRDDAVRAYCAERGIQYMGYGLMGSAQVGACAGVGNEGEGLPTQYLLARHDPRLKAVALQRGISEGELLLAWAQQRGIAPVAFTSRADQAQKNFDRAATPLPDPVTRQLDELFVTPSAAAQGAVTDMAASPLKTLYAAYVDPTAWSIIGQLRTAVGGEALITQVATAIVAAHPLGGGGTAQADALKNFSLNLVRHVADLQSVIQRMQNERDGAIKRNKTAAQSEAVPVVPYADWTAALIPMFTALAAAAGAPHVFALFQAWANRNHTTGHTMGHALEAWGDMALAPAPAPVQAPPPVVAVATIPVAYDAADLASVFRPFEGGDLAEVAPGDVVVYKGAPHVVVTNHTAERRLDLRPNG